MFLAKTFVSTKSLFLIYLSSEKGKRFNRKFLPDTYQASLCVYPYTMSWKPLSVMDSSTWCLNGVQLNRKYPWKTASFSTLKRAAYHQNKGS